MYNLTALVVIFTLLLIIVNSVTSLIDYIPKHSIIALLLIVSILVVINYYLSKKVAANAIQSMEEYNDKITSLLSDMDKEVDNDKLLAMALIDELTGLHNRHGFMPLADQYLKTLNRENAIVYMCYVDIDNMKQINDKYGHVEGNFVIKAVADILQDVFSNSDLIARIGDDEFGVLPAGSSDTNIESINGQLQKKISSFNSTAGKDYSISITCGIAEYNPAEPCSAEELLDRAEKLMLEQKKGEINN